MQEVRKSSYVSSSLLIVRERDNNTLWMVVNDQVEGSQVRIQMDKIAIPNKINFHKQVSKVLYSDLLKSYLNKTKLENKVAKLEEQVKRENEASKGWKVQVKKLENVMVVQGSKDRESRNTKKLLDDKDKQIESLQKKLKMQVIDDPQTDEIMAFQKKNEDLENEVLDLKSKLLQAEHEKQELASKVASHIVPIATQDIDAEGLVDSLSQISLKGKEISTLKEEKKDLEKANKKYQDKNAKLKDRLKGKSVL